MLYEIKFLKAYLHNYLKSSLKIDIRKDSYIFDATQVYIMMKYIEENHPDMKLIGNLATYKLMKSYFLANANFNEQYNLHFAKANERYLSPTKLNALLDTFYMVTRKRYKANKNSYFKNYVDYSFANFYSNTSRSKVYLQKTFIDNKPILYNNYEYMEFFNSFMNFCISSLTYRGENKLTRPLLLLHAALPSFTH